MPSQIPSHLDVDGCLRSDYAGGDGVSHRIVYLGSTGPPSPAGKHLPAGHSQRRYPINQRTHPIRLRHQEYL